jgi:two-component system sensor kinase FixL
MRSFSSVQLPESATPVWGIDPALRPTRRRSRRKLPQCANDIAAAPVPGSRLTAMSAMASTLAHELTQPITASHNYLQASAYLLRQRADGLEDVVAMIEQASAQTLRAGIIIRRMREFLVSGRVQGEPEDLRDLVDKAWAGIACPGVEIVQAVAPGIMVTADRIQIGQVLTNLLTNAVQALEGCAVRRVTIASEPQGRMVALRISDTGCGLSDAGLEGLFEPFHTSKPTGTGLGLALSRTIVEAHGGQLWAERPASGGAVFGLTLPVAART